MLIFVTDEKISAKLCKKKNGKIVLVSDELSLVDVEDGAEAKQFLPPAETLAPLINDGDIDEFKRRYFHYLSDPRVRHILLLYVWGAVDTPTFFVCSKTEKDLKYLKFLREYVIYYLGVPKKYCVKHKDYEKDIKMDKQTAAKIQDMMRKSIPKAKEAFTVYGGSEEE